MPREFPTLEDVSLPNVQGARPVAGIDPSGWGRGAQALAQAGQTLGKDVEQGASDIAEVTAYRNRNSALLAQDQILGNAVQLRQDYKPGGPKWNADPVAMQQSYHADLDNLVNQGIQAVPEGPLRDHVRARIQIPIAREKASIDEEALNSRRQTAHADLYSRGNDLVGQTVGAPLDHAMTEARADNFNDVADDYGRQGLLTPLEVQQHKQNLALRLADAEARGRIDMGPEEAAKVERELRSSGRSTFAPGAPGGRPAGLRDAASLVSRAETGHADLGPEALGNISPDSKGSKSYGFMGLNSASGSAAAFMRDYGGGFGITAQPGTPEFDAQWKAAATYQTDDFRAAQLKYFNERIVPTVSGDLQRHGIPANVASDPRVVTYFADRKVQMDTIALGNVVPAWNGAHGDVPAFLRNMNEIDGTPGELQRNFRSAIDTGVYGPAGHATRLATRLNGALAAGGGAESGPDENFARNRPYMSAAAIKGGPGAFVTDLGKDEPAFRKWVAENHVPFDPDAKGPQDYDMRGFWKALQAGDERTKTAINPNDKQLHYPDYWKTPYHKSFSSESQWANKDAPAWNDKDQLVDPKTGRVVFDERAQSGEAEEAAQTGNPLFSKLTPQHRDALISHAQSMQHKFKTDAYRLLDSNVKDDLAAAARQGYVPQGRSLDEFKAVYGEQGEAVFRDYNEQVQLANDMHNMRSMPPQDRQALIAAHAPTPGEPGYAIKAQRQDNLIKLDKEMTEAEQRSAIEEKKSEVRDLAQRADDRVQEALHTGKIAESLTRDEFISTMGPQDGEAAWNAYTNAVQYAYDSYHLPEQTPEDKLGVAHMYEPAPGQANQDKAWARVGELRHAADKLDQELKDDPAGYMLRYNPSVRNAFQTFQNAATPDDQAKAAQDFAARTISEQQRFGVAPSDIKVVPDAYAENFKGRVEQMALAGNGNQVQALMRAEHEKWGPSWPQVYRQVTDGDAMLRVVGAGVKSSAGLLLTNNAKVKFGDIVKDEQSAKAKEITENVDTAMAPFASSLVGNAGGVRLYNDVRGQVEKLAAIYAFQNGMNAQDAAKQATADVLDFKYDYRDGYRIPAKEHTNPAEVPSDDIQVGASVAKANLGGSVGGIDLAVKPAVDTFGAAYTPEQLAAETADAKRTGRWTTNADESGLAYVYGGQVVRKPDGQPLQLTWKQLGDLAKRPMQKYELGAVVGP